MFQSLLNSNLDGELFHGGLQSCLIPGKISRHSVVKQQKLVLHHFDPVLIKELEFDLNIRAELLELGLFGDEARLGLRHLGHVGRRPGRHVLVVL